MRTLLTACTALLAGSTLAPAARVVSQETVSAGEPARDGILIDSPATLDRSSWNLPAVSVVEAADLSLWSPERYESTVHEPFLADPLEEPVVLKSIEVALSTCDCRDR